ncbi:MAG TPA: DUF5683 domain-containing protein [Flavobacterium sp.]|nr:DUF5683 domain-containing protein [Flavobacterium sp.]
MYRLFAIFLIFLLAASSSVFAQKEADIIVKDSVKANEINPLAPAKAAFYSAILPGLGQAYNKKYWKIPIVYGALGTGIGIYAYNNKNYRTYRDEYKRRLAGGGEEKYKYLSDSQLISAQRQFQKNRDLSLIVTVGIYILNIIDANVDAHLLQFNVNDNLSLRPDLYQEDWSGKQNLGLSLNYKF